MSNEVRRVVKCEGHTALVRGRVAVSRSSSSAKRVRDISLINIVKSSPLGFTTSVRLFRFTLRDGVSLLLSCSVVSLTRTLIFSVLLEPLVGLVAAVIFFLVCGEDS